MTKSFEEQFVHEFYMGKNNKGEYIDDRTRMASFCYEAGQQSKQAEIEELQNRYDAMYRAFTVADDCRKEWHRCYVGVCQREDELQKRIDRAVEHIEDYYGVVELSMIVDILNGEQS